MNFRDSNGESSDGKYISKRVMINGQFVTLYSANGQTWLSSPEDLPALMERLDNARISLSPGEKSPEGEPQAADAKAPAAEEEKPEEKKVLQTKYRMKGPKPRPILRQGGVVIQGTPIEPISASGATMSFSSDVDYESEEDTKAASAKAASKVKGGKKEARVAALPKGAKAKQSGSHNKLVAPVLRKPLAASKQAKGKAEVLQKAAKPVSQKSQTKQSSATAVKRAAKGMQTPKSASPKTTAVKKNAIPVKAKAQPKKVAAAGKKQAAVKKVSKKSKGTKKR